MQLQTKPHAVAIKCTIEIQAMSPVCMTDDFAGALIVLISMQSFNI